MSNLQFRFSILKFHCRQIQYLRVVNFLPKVVEIVKNEDGAIQTAIMASDIIIYSIAEGEFTQEAQTTLDFLQQEIFKKKQIKNIHKKFKTIFLSNCQEAQHFVNPKTFILVSTCLTWLKTKHLDPDDPEIPFTEDDYRKRRTTNNFKDHIALEKVKYDTPKKQFFKKQI